ncbi:MAG TPA: hypothetical protein VFK21_04100 [Gammaproteobacteria bacterium]|nr:hypothetical protein [Gammaproteobacteria bacterium]
MNHHTRRLTTLAALTLGVAVAAYSLSQFPETRLQTVADPERVVDLGTILVTPEDAPPRLGHDGARYAMSEKHHRSSARGQRETTL